jgi:hypothetical protein
MTEYDPQRDKRASERQEHLFGLASVRSNKAASDGRGPLPGRRDDMMAVILRAWDAERVLGMLCCEHPMPPEVTKVIEQWRKHIPTGYHPFPVEDVLAALYDAQDRVRRAA